MNRHIFFRVNYATQSIFIELSIRNLVLWANIFDGFFGSKLQATS